jgi:hypothetical protein
VFFLVKKHHRSCGHHLTTFNFNLPVALAY